MSRVPLPVQRSPLSVMDALTKLQQAGQEADFYPEKTQSAIDYQKALTGRIPFENRLTAAQAQMQENKNPYESDFILSQIMQNKANASRAPFENMLNQASASQINAGIPFIPGLKQAEIEKDQLMNEAQRIKNPFVKSLLESQIARNNALASGIGKGGVVQQAENRYIQSVAQANPGFTPDQVQQAQNAIRAGEFTLSDGTPINSNQTVDDALSAYALKISSNQEKTAIDTRKKLVNFFEMGDSVIDGASQFASMAMKAGIPVQRFFDGFSDKTNPAYQDYLKFNTQIMPGTATQLLLLEGGRPTDQQKLTMQKMVDVVNSGSNATSAKDLWKYLKNTTLNKMVPAATQGIGGARGAAIAAAKKSESQENSQKTAVTEDVIKDLMNRKGMTRQQVVDALKTRGHM